MAVTLLKTSIVVIYLLNVLVPRKWLCSYLLNVLVPSKWLCSYLVNVLVPRKWLCSYLRSILVPRRKEHVFEDLMSLKTLQSYTTLCVQNPYMLSMEHHTDWVNDIVLCCNGRTCELDTCLWVCLHRYVFDTSIPLVNKLHLSMCFWLLCWQKM